MKDDLEKKVEDTIKKYHMIQPQDKIVVAVSGGPDSITLLSVLNNLRTKYNLDLVVAHVNHKIRKEAIIDEEYVQEFCNKINVEFFVKSIDVKELANNNKIGLEEAGRNVRYDFFEEVLEKTNSNKIAIAHNKNDSVETIIMNIFRGTGVQGLKGIEPIMENKFIRPLIECEKPEIEKYCEIKKLNPKIDKTNFENDYTRNKIRNVVIPYIKKEFNPNIISTITRLSEVINRDDEYLNKVTKEKYLNLLIEKKDTEIILNLKEFNLLENSLKSRLIIYTISRLFGNSKNIEKVHIDDIIKLCDNNIGNKYLTPNKNIKVFVKKHKIFFIKQI